MLTTRACCLLQTMSPSIFPNLQAKSSPNKLIYFKTLHHCKQLWNVAIYLGMYVILSARSRACCFLVGASKQWTSSAYCRASTISVWKNKFKSYYWSSYAVVTIVCFCRVVTHFWTIKNMFVYFHIRLLFARAHWVNLCILRQSVYVYAPFGHVQAIWVGQINVTNMAPML